MAIRFARCEAISRGKGGNVVQRIAYATRTALIDERTGKRIPRRGEGEPEHVAVMVLKGVSGQYLNLGTIANAINSAERRKDACTGYEFVFPLPANKEITLQDRVAIITEFCTEHFLSKGVPVIITLHKPHNLAVNPDSLNYHAHVIVGTRPLTADGFACKKAADLIPKFIKIGRRPVISQAERWGEIWGRFQDDWFQKHGKNITADPLLPVKTEHLGPRRFQNPLSPKVQRAADLRAVNKAIQTYHQRLADGQKRLETAARLDRVPSGWRALTVEDVARDLSPRYVEAIKRVGELEGELRIARLALAGAQTDREVAEYRIQERWQQMGVLQRAKHVRWKPHMGVVKKTVYRFARDRELNDLERGWRRSRYAIKRQTKRIAALEAALTEAQEDVAGMIDGPFPVPGAPSTLRQTAESELQRRQQIAHVARQQLATSQKLIISPATQRPRMTP